MLVVDASPETVGASSTDPKELLKFHEAGVEIHHAEQLHAKVFVFGRVAIVGSCNASSRSEAELLEAAIETTQHESVAACADFVTPLNADDLTELLKHWNPPKATRHPRPKKRAASSIPPVWLVPLVNEEWDDRAKAVHRKERPQALAAIHSETEMLDSFHWEGKRFVDRLTKGDLVVQAFKEGRAPRKLCTPSRVIRIASFKEGRVTQMIAYLGRPKRTRRIAWADAVSQLGTHANKIRNLNHPRLITGKASTALQMLWPTLSRTLRRRRRLGD